MNCIASTRCNLKRRDCDPARGPQGPLELVALEVSSQGFSESLSAWQGHARVI